MITREHLKEACRAHDNASDAGTDYKEIWLRRGADVKDVVYIAQQRALRVILEMRGERPDATKATTVALEPSEQPLFMKLAAMWMDGLAVGMFVTEGK